MAFELLFTASYSHPILSTSTAVIVRQQSSYRPLGLTTSMVLPFKQVLQATTALFNSQVLNLQLINLSFNRFFPWPHRKVSSILKFIRYVRLIDRLCQLVTFGGGKKRDRWSRKEYGDFEAQRHWMEITINLSATEWYRNSTSNDLSYWGLDYPPLTAYQSYIHGQLLKLFLPESVSLFTSRGHESYLGKLLMRWTVLSSDSLVFFPAVLYFIVVYIRLSNRRINIAWLIAMVLLNPCLIIIDHGHFQYNCISLGLTVGAIAAILSNRELVACALFCFALNHKQMSAYFAPAFFCHLLGRCLRCRNPFLEVSKLGLVVLGTFLILWWPYLHSTEAFLGVLSRLAPFERGIYEDYVANFWCTTSVLFKWRKLFTVQSLKLLSLSATLLTSLPSMVQQLRAPSNLGFLYALVNSSFSFYLFSFQVHEKSILLPLLPSSLLALEEPLIFGWLNHFAMLSMFPLLCRDKLSLAYISLLALFTLLYFAPGGRQDPRKTRHPSTLRLFIMAVLVLSSLVLHVIYLTMHPPKRYPFLFEAIIMLLCFSQFALLAVYTNTKQWTLSKKSTWMDKEKKQL
ncbi:hypothetical protein Nepgr_006145 [Nepenthes gracilis]|uniref:Alpha-1,3-glucosyltransferase n=1 Tax=Nepenthes gracilis TaxID=150966 RepID=A0AAD3XHB1_NEPGR|nr:hypothetical protein Nepgr_006145 [Nepenthes gracilis]